MSNEKIVIFAHGMTVNRYVEAPFVGAAEQLRQGYSTLLFDFRAHGSEGNFVTDFTASNELLDLDSVVSWAKREGYKWIGLAGASFGGGISALYAAGHPGAIQKLLLANPCLNYKNCFFEPNTPWCTEYFHDWQKKIKRTGFIEVGSPRNRIGSAFFQDLLRHDPGEALKAYDGPLLILHGDQDSVVSYSDVVACYKALSNKYKAFETIKGSDHGFGEEPYTTQVTTKIVEFFKR